MTGYTDHLHSLQSSVPNFLSPKTKINTVLSLHLIVCYNEYILIIALHDIGCQYLIYCIYFLSTIVIKPAAQPSAKSPDKKGPAKRCRTFVINLLIQLWEVCISATWDSFEA